MFNVNGVGKPGCGASVGNAVRTADKRAEKDEKKKPKNTDRADFSPFAEKLAGKQGAMKVGAASEKTGGLSQKAQDYLEKLKKKYGSMDFIIADYSTDDEADKLLSKGKGEYNVLITPDLLEKMADDEDTAAEYEALIDKSVESIDSVRGGLGEDADMVERYGVTVGADGQLSIRALLAGDLTNKDGGKSVTASTVDEMLSQLKETKEAQAEKLAKLREERAKAAEEEEDDADDTDTVVKRINDDRREASLRMNAVMSKNQKTELEELLKGIDGEVSNKESGHHSHFTAKA